MLHRTGWWLYSSWFLFQGFIVSFFVSYIKRNLATQKTSSHYTCTYFETCTCVYLLGVANHLSAGTFWHPTTVWVPGGYTGPIKDHHTHNQSLMFYTLKKMIQRMVLQVTIKLTSCTVRAFHIETMALWPHRKWKPPTKFDSWCQSASRWCACLPHHLCCI